MTDFDRSVLFRWNIAKLLTYTGGVIAICATVIHKVDGVESTLGQHEYRINKVELRQDKIEANFWKFVKK